jgi:aminopeptidase N
MKKRSCLLTALLFSCCCSFAQPLQQKQKYSRQDTLRGSITPERAWWDVLSYNIGVAPDFATKTIEGKNEIQFKVLQPGSRMQIDLQQPMEISRAYNTSGNLKLEREGNVYYINFPQPLKEGSVETVTLVYHGKPKEAVNPPWDGGWIWKKDAQGRPWMSVACQGLGASVWYPCKDHQSDEPDSAYLNIAVPDTLVAIGNGKLKSKVSHSKGMITYKWSVTNPINSYNIIPYIGKYVNFGEGYKGEKGTLNCSYWVLDYDLDKAKKQFTQVPQMLKAFEHWFGPYPFYEDDFKLVESPHLGMEHQSAVAYGNKFLNGYLGNDLSGTGWGMKWDYIIVHESGHEWFANNITTKDIADMWVHEGFTDYSETLFTEHYYGKDAGNTYVQGLRNKIENDKPIIGVYGVNQEGSGDMYFKGANIIHTVRQIVNDDEKFRNILRGLNKEFYHQTVTTKQVEEYISKRSGKDLSKLFDQYLRTSQVPVLELKANTGGIESRWTNCIEGFTMPVKLTNGQWIEPTTEWSKTPLNDAKIDVDTNFYIKVRRL